ncbi:MAG TPA: ElyC/SanA/YdcF family protein [Anaerolineales bacterium]|nr:ElyC/SanA/YdcF family protein [Anaerolineales bacterium]
MRSLPSNRLLLALGGLTLLSLTLPRWLLWLRYAGRIHAPADSPAMPVAIVFGAGLRRDGTPTRVLADRVAAAAGLYEQGLVARLLLTGSASGLTYDEAGSMAAMAVDLGVPVDALWVDPFGQRTMTSCRRAREVFGITQALLVTQRFHLPRALALCDAVGIRAEGVASDLSRYGSRISRFWELREYPASLVALLEAAFHQVAALPGPDAHDA